MRIYDLVKQILTNEPNTRSSDKLLIWLVWEKQNLTGLDLITYSNFCEAASSKTITRARRMIQAEERERVKNGEIDVEWSLLPSKEVQEWRYEIERQKGTHVFREEI